jgi:hypothetical protein
MDIIVYSNTAFQAYFKYFRKESMVNSERHQHFLNYILGLIVIPPNINIVTRNVIGNHLNMMKGYWEQCFYEPYDELFDQINNEFCAILKIYFSNNQIVEYYNNVLKQILESTINDVEKNQYKYTINNLRFMTESYTSQYYLKYE